jgi:hypothetical protein
VDSGWVVDLPRRELLLLFEFGFVSCVGNSWSVFPGKTRFLYIFCLCIVPCLYLFHDEP